jgi:hypothetical protein
VDYNIEALINASAMVGIALLLKNRLKKTYGLTEEYAFVRSLTSCALD